MNDKAANSQLNEVKDAIMKIHQDANIEYPLNSAFPVGCEERAAYIDRHMADVKKRFPKAFQ